MNKSGPVTRSHTKQRVQERAGWDYEPLSVAKPKATEQLPLRRSPRLNKVDNIQLNIVENTYDDDSDYYPESDNDDIDFEDSIDFEEASRAWRQNKTHIGNGMFKYNTRSRSNAR